MAQEASQEANPGMSLGEMQAEYDRLDGWRNRWLALAKDSKRMAARWPLQSQMEYIQSRAERANAAIARLLRMYDESQEVATPPPTGPSGAGITPVAPPSPPAPSDKASSASSSVAAAEEPPPSPLRPYQAKVDEALAKLVLPLDATQEQVQAAVRTLRPHFETRTEYNFMVADLLAQRGMAPNGANVLAAGGWGNPSSVAADMKLWYAGLSARLSAEHAHIPDSARRTANGLIEQLWSLAQACTQAPMAEMSQHLATEKAARAYAEQALAEAIAQNELLGREVASQRAQAQLREQALKEQIATRQTEIDGLHDQLDALRSSIVQAALLHQQEIQSTKDKFHADMQRQQEAHQQAAVVMQARLDTAQEMVLEKTTAINELGRQHALALDSYRQDAKAAAIRADRAQQETERVRSQLDEAKDQLAMAGIDKARLQQRMAILDQELGKAAAAMAKSHQRQPLTKEQLDRVLKAVADSLDSPSIVMTHWPNVARAVEAEHDIVAN